MNELASQTSGVSTLRFGAYGAAAVAALALTLTYALVEFFNFYPDSLSQLTDVITSGAATLFAALALRRYGVHPTRPFSDSWFLFTVGIGCRFVGEVIYQFYDSAYGNPFPFPSVGNAFSLVGYALLFGGMMLYVRLFVKALSRKKVVAVALAVAVTATVGYLLLLSPSELAAVRSLPGEELVTTYGVFHFLVFTAALLGFAEFGVSRVGRSWLVMIGAVLTTLFGDLLFFYAFTSVSFALGVADNVVSAMGYTLFALAFQIHRTEFG
jgi:hypothetical protein